MVSRYDLTFVALIVASHTPRPLERRRSHRLSGKSGQIPCEPYRLVPGCHIEFVIKSVSSTGTVMELTPAIGSGWRACIVKTGPTSAIGLGEERDETHNAGIRPISMGDFHTRLLRYLSDLVIVILLLGGANV